MYQYFPAPAVLLALSTALLAVPAQAQDAGSFEGPRIEATVGLDQLRFDLGQVGGAGRDKVSDLGYGLSAGYDRALSPTMIAGIEVGVNLSDVAYPDSDAAALRKRREIVIAGRLGTPITPTTLLYGKLGYANLQVRDIEGTRDLDGVTLGAGAEAKISSDAYLKGEYRYTDYADGYVANGVLTGVGIRF